MVETVPTPYKASPVLIMVCLYIFLVIERPWETIRYLNEIPIEKTFAIVLILVAVFSGKFKLVSSPTNIWVYSLLALHFILAPFAFNTGDAIDQGIEYAKMVMLYLLMLSVVDDEESLRFLIKAYIFSMFFYMLHSLWEYHNGRYQVRMGITRMVGADFADPNSYGASIVLSLPFAFMLLRTEISRTYKKFYYLYLTIAIICIVLTGSRSTFVALLFLLLVLSFFRRGKRIKTLIIAVISIGLLWVSMPAEKQNRIRTLWDQDAGPENAHTSAEGRKIGWKVSWRMFKQEPFTGVGAGGKNFIGYRLENKIDDEGEEAALQPHILYGQILAGQGVFGAILFLGLVVSITRSIYLSVKTDCNDTKITPLLSVAIISSLLLLLVLGFGGHNFYRPLWLWLAAWAGSLLAISKHQNIQNDLP